MIGVLPTGSEVVCINAKPLPGPLREGEIYTVRGYTRACDGRVAVLLDEIGDGLEGAGERGFQCWRFRRLMLPPSLTGVLDEN